MQYFELKHSNFLKSYILVDNGYHRPDPNNMSKVIMKIENQYKKVDPEKVKMIANDDEKRQDKKLDIEKN